MATSLIYFPFLFVFLQEITRILEAQTFYEKLGGGAIILAISLPIVRTFAPIVAGIVGMNFRKFAFCNIVCAIIWAGSLVTLGYLLGENPWVQKSLEYDYGDHCISDSAGDW